MQSDELLMSPPIAVTGNIQDIDNVSETTPQSGGPNSVDSSGSLKFMSSKSRTLNSASNSSRTPSNGESVNTGGEPVSCGGDNVVELDGEMPVPELPCGENPLVTDDTHFGEKVAPLLLHGE